MELSIEYKGLKVSKKNILIICVNNLWFKIDDLVDFGNGLLEIFTQ